MNYTKEIRYDRETKDFAMILDGEVKGYRASYLEAEIALDKIVYDLLDNEVIYCGGFRKACGKEATNTLTSFLGGFRSVVDYCYDCLNAHYAYEGTLAMEAGIKKQAEQQKAA